MRRRHVWFGLSATTAILVVSALGASAQLDKLKDTTPKERATMQTEFMKSKLGLTADQTPKIAALNLQFAE